jgi:alkanesulfonate monooxygenase SsuD/methylene tetrahydromethanopterin reductase-like flavin-dependent oxidoreductase (luciferase family)
VQAELPMWIGGSSDAAIRRTGRYGTGWQAGLDGLDDIGRVIVAIKAAAAAAGRTIDEDHYGAGVAFHFGSADEPEVVQAKAQVVRRVGRDVPSYFAIGDAEAILASIAALVAAGGGEAAVLTQTGRLIDEVLPAVAARWPRRAS